jgi:hypothetical protein
MDRPLRSGASFNSVLRGTWGDEVPDEEGASFMVGEAAYTYRDQTEEANQQAFDTLRASLRSLDTEISLDQPAIPSHISYQRIRIDAPSGKPFSPSLDSLIEWGPSQTLFLR